MDLPKTIKHYSLQSLLGEGEIAFVYRATNTVSGQEVALKVLRMDSPVSEAQHYFENEATILAQLNHPNIPKFYGYLAENIPCLAMHAIDGNDGETLLKDLPDGYFLPMKSVIRWGIQIADALAYLHNHHPPIAFRDLKPAHIVVNNANQAWLVDFNLAKILPSDRLLTGADLIGTEGFAAPEQYQGVVSPLVDIYALGATLHYLLTRIDPRKERRFTYTPLRAINPAVPKAVAAIITKALAYEPEDRFQRIEEMRAALQSTLAAV